MARRIVAAMLALGLVQGGTTAVQAQPHAPIVDLGSDPPPVKRARPPRLFISPSGEPFRHGSLSARQQIVALLAADGYVGATTDPGMSGISQSSQSPLTLLRIRVDGRSTLQFFINTLPW